ncbi:MAG TPA: hypothetical protein VM409_08670 [Chloroflexia bacterium]|nr:hypothetical protein [Chloroflexia bacterium]
MQTPARRAIGIIFVLALITDLAATFYMYVTLGLADTPVESLPPLFWVLLLIALVIMLAITNLPIAVPAEREAHRGAIPPFFLGAWLFFAGFNFFMAYLSNLLHPHSGGNTTLQLFSGCIFGLVAYAGYRRIRAVK